MSLNTAHLNGGVLIHNGEQILLFSDNVTLEWSGQQSGAFNGSKRGSIYLTTHRVIFLNNNFNDGMLSFSFPFVTLSEVEIEQPVFGANYIKGKVRAQPNGNWIGEAKFKLTFKHGGAIEFGQSMLKAAHLASRGGMQSPPPYVPPQTQWYAAPPPAYAAPPQGYYGWMPPTNVFPQHPPTDGVFMTDAPPPYPGIVPGYQPNSPWQQQAGFQPPGYPQNGPPTTGGYQPSGPWQQQAGFQPPGYPQNGPPMTGDPKMDKAAQAAYYDPTQPQMAYVPPPAYYENPPSYNQATNKKTN